MEHPAEEGPENGNEGPEAGKYRAEEVGDAGGHLPGQVLCLLGKVLDNAGVLGMAEGVEERGERPLEIAEGGSLIGGKGGRLPAEEALTLSEEQVLGDAEQDQREEEPGQRGRHQPGITGSFSENGEDCGLKGRLTYTRGEGLPRLFLSSEGRFRSHPNSRNEVLPLKRALLYFLIANEPLPFQ